MRPQNGILNLAVFLLIVTFAIGWHVAIKTEQIHRNQLLIGTGLERVEKYNASLSSTLTITVLERNILRAASYATLDAQLDATLAEIASLATEIDLADEIQTLRDERAQLQRSEGQALELMRNDRWTEAARVLFDDDYLMARKLYEINTDTAVGALSGGLGSLAARFERLNNITFALRLGAILLLLWAGSRHSRRLRQELAEQERLREAVSAANTALEQKVIERTRQLEEANAQLEALSITDGLTGLNNRRKLDASWDAAWKQGLRQHHPLAVLLIDVDHFKAYNDRYGHQGGDACLIRVGEILSTSLRRAGECAGRYGGEEFMIILPYVSALEASHIAERIRERVEAAQIPHATSSAAAVVTVSIGVAAGIPDGAEPSRQLIEHADRALYQAKHAGRNQVAVAAP